MEKLCIVCVGRTCATPNRKPAEFFRPYDDAVYACADIEALHQGAGLFLIGRRDKAVIGGVYETEGEVEDGRIVRLAGDRRFIQRIQTDALTAAALESEGADQIERSRKAEESARKAALAGYENAVRQLAGLVAKASPMRQRAVLEGINRAILDEARKIKRR
jgi:hypothetical protein